MTEVRLTARGRVTIAKALPAWRKAQAAMEKRLGSERIALLRALATDLPAILDAPSRLAKNSPSTRRPRRHSR